MNKVAVMTDTNSGIIPSEAVENGIYLLQMPFFVDGKEFVEYGSMEYDEFFARLSAGAEVSTSQPSPAALCDMWDKILKTNDQIIYIPMSSGLSGTYETARMLAQDYEGKVFVADNKRISVTLRSSVYDALNLLKNGFSAKETIEKLEESALNASIYISVSTLEYLKKGGRVTPAGAAIGSLLGIKPVLQIQGDKLDAYKKVRGMNAAIEAMLQGIENDLKTRFAGKEVTIRTAFTGKRSTAQTWSGIIAERFPGYDIGLDALPVSISCHLGPGAIGIGIYEIIK